MNIKIVNRFDLTKVLYEGDAETLKELVEKACNEGADLTGAYLTGADLTGADLTGADLTGANLTGADLRGANLTGAYLTGAKIDGEEITKEPLMIQGLYYWVLITECYMRIGCKRFTHSEWENFNAVEISNMDSTATEFWSEWKNPLLTFCKNHSKKGNKI